MLNIEKLLTMKTKINVFNISLIICDFIEIHKRLSYKEHRENA